MAAGFSIGVLLVAMVVLVAFGDRERIGGLTPQELAGLAMIFALAIPFVQRARMTYGGQWSKGVQALAFWLGAILLIVGLHSYRFELSDAAHRIYGALTPGVAWSTRGGEVVITRQDGGSFVVDGRVDHAPARFVFDTGATTVMLTEETARRAGFRIADDDYTIPISTANGSTMAARIRITALTIGAIREDDVRALVARPGSLRENLLGMSFLERLASYRVEGDRLILRAR